MLWRLCVVMLLSSGLAFPSESDEDNDVSYENYSEWLEEAMAKIPVLNFDLPDINLESEPLPLLDEIEFCLGHIDARLTGKDLENVNNIIASIQAAVNTGANYSGITLDAPLQIGEQGASIGNISSIGRIKDECGAKVLETCPTLEQESSSVAKCGALMDIQNSATAKNKKDKTGILQTLSPIGKIKNRQEYGNSSSLVKSSSTSQQVNSGSDAIALVLQKYGMIKKK